MCEKEDKYRYKIDNGIWLIEPSVESWKDFHDLLLNKSLNLKIKGRDSKLTKGINLKDFVWRGQKCSDKPLVSLFDRIYKVNDRKKKLKQHLNSFIYACRGKLKQFGLNIPQLKEWINKSKILEKEHMWALGQHYGLATLLLDWCYSPFTAAYFTFEKENLLEDIDWKSNSKKFKDLQKMCEGTEQNNSDINKKIKDKFSFQNRVVWGFNFKEVCRNCKNVFKCNFCPKKCNPDICKEKCLLYFDPMSSEHPRLINQKGLFTISNTGESIEDIVKEYWSKNKDEEPWLIKITINTDQRKEFLRNLDAMNINHMTLFPEIYGAAKFCNIGLEENLEDYALFHGQD